MSRKIISFALSSTDDALCLCDDGTMWTLTGGAGWQKMEPIPQDEDPMFSEVEPAPYSHTDWPPPFLESPTLRLYAWSHDRLTELTDSNGLILAVRTNCAIIEATDGADALRGARQEFASFRKMSTTHKGIAFSYWSDTIPF